MEAGKKERIPMHSHATMCSYGSTKAVSTGMVLFVLDALDQENAILRDSKFHRLHKPVYGVQERKGMESITFRVGGGRGKEQQENCGGFQVPLNYPRYSRTEYETMAESQLDLLLTEYGLPMVGNVEQKRKFAMGAFLWPR
ncbi:hypothetical protein DKX38_018337 [Salix brachista]|uniref:DUF7722 domain-containing protein n=1 Tax=Salix brachista TaxID=2182728 RepID=A0A5N5KMW0_9ROSI|nr:hypothetical protein DKX38_018337 [Salix brachista]